MDPETPAPPPEARRIRTAREAAGMTAAQAAQASNGAVSATYWRDVERGYGGRRGQRAPARASARLLAAMAQLTGVTPDQLAEDQREDAARVLAEIQRREDGGHPGPRALQALPGAGAPPPGSPSEKALADLVAAYPDDDVIAAMAAQRRKDPAVIVAEVYRWLDFLAAQGGRGENGASAGLPGKETFRKR